MSKHKWVYSYSFSMINPTKQKQMYAKSSATILILFAFFLSPENAVSALRLFSISQQFVNISRTWAIGHERKFEVRKQPLFEQCVNFLYLIWFVLTPCYGLATEHTAEVECACNCALRSLLFFNYLRPLNISRIISMSVRKECDDGKWIEIRQASLERVVAFDWIGFVLDPCT